MAIDTAAKRRSVGGVAFLPLGPGVTPDATPDVFWRQSAAWGYGGIPAGTAADADVVDSRRYRLGYRYGWVNIIILYLHVGDISWL